MMWSETCLSSTSSGLSSNMKTKSNRESRAALIFKFSFTVFARLQFGFSNIKYTKTKYAVEVQVNITRTFV